MTNKRFKNIDRAIKMLQEFEALEAETPELYKALENEDRSLLE